MTMRIYVACLASYNNGVLFGRWINADACVDVMQEQVDTILRDSPFPNVTVRHPETGETVPSAEEWAIHDFEGLPSSLGEYSGLQAVADVVALVEDTDWLDADAVITVIDDCGGDVDEAGDMLDDRFVGIFNDFQDYADELADETLLSGVPDNVTCYFNYEAFARDLKMDHHVILLSDGREAVFHA